MTGALPKDEKPSETNKDSKPSIPSNFGNSDIYVIAIFAIGGFLWWLYRKLKSKKDKEKKKDDSN